MAPDYSSITDPTNRFNTSGLSREVHALLRYCVDARAHLNIPIYVTCTTDHGMYTAAGNISNHRKVGTDGEGLAIDFRLERGQAPHQHDAAFRAFTHVADQLAELIYAYEPKNVRNGQWVDPYAVSTHKDHCHTAVRKGVFVVYPNRVQISTPTVFPPVHFPEDNMTRHDHLIRTDANGNGWIALDVDPAAVVSLVANGSNPETDGYWNIPVLARQDRAGKTIVTIGEAPASTEVMVSVWTAA